MKRSTNFSHTRKSQKPMSAAAKFLRDLGYTDEQIAAKLFPAHVTQENKSDDTPQEPHQ